jgi:fumarate reductase flavoprotein subunit
VVKVKFNKNAIAHIEVTENNETPVISDYAIEKIPVAILNSQSTEVDAVSGATESSEGIKRAVEDAVRKALRK